MTQRIVQLRDYGDLSNIIIRGDGRNLTTIEEFLMHSVNPSDCEKARQGITTKFFCMGRVIIQPKEQPTKTPTSVGTDLNTYPILNDKESMQFAYDYADQLTKNGTRCYVRNWHCGEVGWFVIDYDSYARLLSSGQPEKQRGE